MKRNTRMLKTVGIAMLAAGLTLLLGGTGFALSHFFEEGGAEVAKLYMEEILVMIPIMAALIFIGLWATIRGGDNEHQ
jgi:hypothetical protein